MRFNNRIVNFGDTHVTTHLSDDQLMETYVLAGDNRHLAVCRPCKTRFDELVRSLQQMHEAAVVEADSAFTRRTASRPARSHHAAHRASRSPGRGRGISASACAGAPSCQSHTRPGAPLGRGRRGRRSRRGRVPRVRHGSARSGRSIRRVQQSKPDTSLALQAAADDQFFIDIDEALIGSRVREMRPDLSAIDIMTTPLEIREVSYVRE